MGHKNIRMKKIFLVSVLFVAVVSLVSFKKNVAQPNISSSQNDSLLYEGEKHFANMQQLTFGGDNAEAYFSFDGKYIVFKSFANNLVPIYESSRQEDILLYENEGGE